MTRSEIFANSIAELRNYIGKGLPQLATCEFTDAVHAAMMTPGCESQRVRLVDLPRLAERVAEMADAHEALRAERDELAATLANERGEGEPPEPGWTPVDVTPGRWQHCMLRLDCYRIQTRDYIVILRGSLNGELAREKTARAAMRAAAGVKS